MLNVLQRPKVLDWTILCWDISLNRQRSQLDYFESSSVRCEQFRRAAGPAREGTGLPDDLPELCVRKLTDVSSWSVLMRFLRASATSNALLCSVWSQQAPHHVGRGDRT